MSNPGHHLIDKDILALAQDDADPSSQPFVALLEDLIKDVDDDSSPVLFGGYTNHYLPNLPHNEFVFGGLCSDVAEGEIPVLEVVPLNTQDETFVLLHGISQALSHCLSVYAGVLLKIGVGCLGQFVVDEFDDLRVVEAYLGNLVYEIGLRSCEDS